MAGLQTAVGFGLALHCGGLVRFRGLLLGIGTPGTPRKPVAFVDGLMV